MILLGVFAGSRNITLGGYDTDVYYRAYLEVPDSLMSALEATSFNLSSMEKGYITLNWIAKTIGFNFNEFLLTLGIISSLGLFLVFKKHSKYYFVVILIFLSKGYLYYFFTAQRQILAMVLCWYAIHFLQNKKPWVFALLVLLAFQFHTSALIFFLVYFCQFLKLSNRWAVIAVGVSSVIGISNIGLILGESVSAYLPGENFGEKLNVYLENSSSGINLFNFVELVPVFFIFLHFRDKLEKEMQNFNLFFNIFIIFLCLTFAFYNFQFIARLKGYFIIGYILLIASLFDVIYKRVRLGALMIIVLYCFAVFVRELLVFDDGNGYLPYSSFLFE